MNEGPQWQLEGDAAELYERYVHRYILGPWVPRLLDAAGLRAGESVLDVACGTGHLVAAASKRGAISEGIDFAQAMVDAARTTYPAENFRVADATELPHDNHSLDAVTCAFGLSHMEHPKAAVDEAFRVLKAGGRFAFTLWFGPEDGNEFYQMVQEALTALATTSFVLPEKWTQLRLADEQACKAITLQAGFGTPSFKKIPIVWQTDSAHDVAALADKLSVRTRIQRPSGNQATS